MRDKLIAAGVKNLQEFGYPACNKDNILTDTLYREFFVTMLEVNKGNGAEIDQVIASLIAEVHNQTIEVEDVG